MLDAKPVELDRFGTVTVMADGRIRVEGFAANGGSCRDVAALAALWAIGELQRELLLTMQRPGGGSISVD